MFPVSFTTRLVIPTPAPLNSPTTTLSSNPPAFQSNDQQSPIYPSAAGSSSSLPMSATSAVSTDKSRVNQLRSQASPSSSSSSLPQQGYVSPVTSSSPNQPYPTGPSTDSVHDTLTDIEEAISEFSSANPSYDNILTAQQPQPQQQPRHHYSQLTSTSQSSYLPTSAQQAQYTQDNTSRSSSISAAASSSTTPPPPTGVPLQFLDVLSWTPAQVKKHFLSLGYEPAVCECFQRHQITGNILLELDLAYLKEIDIPSFGTRFQISKVIKNLNAIVKANGAAPDTVPQNTDTIKLVMDSSSKPQEQQQPQQQPAQQKYTSAVATTTISPTSPTNNPTPAQGLMAPPVFKRQSVLRTAKDNAYLNDYLLKQQSQQNQYGRTSSSQDSLDVPFDFPLKSDPNESVYKPSNDSVPAQKMRQYHKKDSSFDRNWKVPKMPTATTTTTTKPNNKNGSTDEKFKSATDQQQFYQESSSGGGRHSRKSSYVEETRKRHGNSHSRQTSNDTIRGNGLSNDPGSTSGDGGSTLYSHQHSRSISSIGLSDFKYLNKFTTSDDPFPMEQDETQAVRRRSSLLSVILAGGAPGDQKSMSSSEDNYPPPMSKKEAVAAAIAASKQQNEHAIASDDEEDGDANSQEQNGSTEEDGAKRVGTDPTLSNISLGSSDSGPRSVNFMKKKSLRSSSSHTNLRKSKSKKQGTSAFLEGIKRITAAQAKKTADFSGWMNKRGSATVGTWKARYFTLHGTRLSYFTSFSDTRERGLIDITSHRVVPVGDEDKFVAIYAASVGAGRHCFKVVPPSPGSRKGVTFTVPKVHYFAVETAEEMREWMNALMKATIDRDDSVPIMSSCATPTVSLARAREMFAEARVREDELRAKAIAENNTNSASGNWLNGIGGQNSPDINGTPTTPDSPSRSLSLRSDTGSSLTGSSSVLRHHTLSQHGSSSPSVSGGSGAFLNNISTPGGSAVGNTNSTDYHGSPISGGTTVTGTSSSTNNTYSTLAERNGSMSSMSGIPIEAKINGSLSNLSNGGSNNPSNGDMRHLTAKTAGLRIVTDLN